MMNEKVVLIVDDSKFDRELLALALNKNPRFVTLQAESGEECMRIIENQHVDLVLMDIMMPGDFGTHTLMKIRKKFNQIELPVIMVTSKDDTSDIVGSLQNGANDYIVKPVNFSICLSRIATHLKLSEVSSEMSQLKSIAALDALIVTYNHEINNPLTIALGCLDEVHNQNAEAQERLKSALLRIADIIKKIDSISAQKKLEYANYVGTQKMLKLKR